MPVLMQIPGVRGESTLKEHDGWMILTGFDWGGRRAARMQSGGTHGTATGFSSMQLRNIHVRRQTDSASAALWHIMHTARRSVLKIDWMRTGPDGNPARYFSINLRDAVIVSIEAVSFGQRPEETLSIMYSEVEAAVFSVDDGLGSNQEVYIYEVPQHAGR